VRTTDVVVEEISLLRRTLDVLLAFLLEISVHGHLNPSPSAAVSATLAP
jgi:hypothetical protein